MADELALPVISCKYDTFTVAALLNRALSERMIKKQIILVGDIIRKDIPLTSIHQASTVGHLKS